MLEFEKYDNTENLLEEALKTEPQFLLSATFAEQVAEKVSRKFAWSQYLKEFFIYLSTVAGIGLGIAAFSLFWFGADWKLWLEFVTVNFSLVIGVSIILVFILFADRVVLRYFMFRSDMEVV